MRKYNIAAMGGDGIGPEVVEAGVQVLKVCAERDGGFILDFQDFDWGSRYYRNHGVMMPADGASQLRNFDAILFGAVGAPDIPTQSGHLRALENRQSRGRHRAICREGPRCRCAAASLDHLVGAAEYR